MRHPKDPISDLRLDRSKGESCGPYDTIWHLPFETCRGAAGLKGSSGETFQKGGGKPGSPVMTLLTAGFWLPWSSS